MKHLIATLLLSLASAAQADATSTLREFVHDVKTGRAQFTQTVTSPDGVKKKTSSGSFEFSRPNRFKFNYTQPFQQLIVADGKKVWIFDADLNQASSRPFSSALGATPAALLAGTSLDTDFDLAEQPAQDGLAWVQAKPKQADSTFKSLRVGFKGKELAAIEILDAFGQRSLLQFSQFTPGVALADDVFRYTPPKGVDVMEQ
jgi:outer membrane lipoprotein carrier protein